MSKKAINIRLDETILSELDSYAKELDRTRTYLIEKAVTNYFDTKVIKNLYLKR
jgi:predicted transcriptional regulator